METASSTGLPSSPLRRYLFSRIFPAFSLKVTSLFLSERIFTLGRKSYIISTDLISHPLRISSIDFFDSHRGFGCVLRRNDGISNRSADGEFPSESRDSTSVFAD